jgi:hypothetical protein
LCFTVGWIPWFVDSLQQCDAPDIEIPLLPNLQDLRFGQNAIGSLKYTYLGGLADPPGLASDNNAPDGSVPVTSGSTNNNDPCEYADFTDKEDGEV